MALTFIVTNAGRAALVNAANTGTAPVVIAQVGISATALAPTPATAALPGEFKRIVTLSGDVVADDTIHLIVRDESSDVFTVRSIALYLGDGTLFGLYGQAPVLIEKSAQAMMLLGIDVRFEDIAATNITFGDANFLNPPATTEQIGVVELATLTEAIAGIDTSRVPAAKVVKDAVTAWLDARFGANNASIWHPGNDGAGSGLDADLLDGQDGGYYSNITARLGYTPVQQGTGNGQLGNTVKLGWSGARLKASVDVADLGNLVFDGHIADVWRASNDGAGSGLDADLLDGQDGSYYSNITARLGYIPANKAGDVFTGPIQLRGGAAQQLTFDGGAQPSWRWISTINGSTPGNIVLQYSSDKFASNFVNALDATPGGVLSSAVQGTLWGVSNDGAGSGMDADLLDGQDGSYYTNIIARLGYTPLNSTAYTAADVRAKLITVDGSGSGVDADLLDGQDGSYYSNIIARLGYTPANKAGEVFTGDIEIRHGPTQQIMFNGGGQPSWRLISEINGAASGKVVLQYSNDKFVSHFVNAMEAYPSGWLYASAQGQLWGASNDGSGSGLDADLLDGLQASDFVKYVNFTKATNYEILPDGRILQWGFADALNTRATTTITFPIAFPNGALQLLASLGTSLTLTENRVGCGAAPISNTQGNIALAANFSGTIGVTWLAIGH